MGMVAILINGPRPFVQIFNPTLTEGFRRNLKKIDLGVQGSCSKVWTIDDRWKDDGRRVITIAHPQLR